MPDLIYDLAAIPEGGHELAITVPSATFSLESSDVHLRDPVALQAGIQRVGDTVAVRGTVAATAEVPCGRCLEPAVISLEAALEVVAVPASEMPDGEDHALTASETDLYYYTGEALDMGAIVWDHLVSAIPLQPLCHPDCKGLCASCGTNLNRETCACSAEEGDERFAALKQWQGRD
ncbi:MAG: DUF177 domain-containing protein [Nitrospinota bacterium]